MLGQIAAEEHRPERHPPLQTGPRAEPQARASLFGLAAAYAELDRFDDALVGFRRILELKGSDARSSLAIADIYFRLERFDDAAAVLEKASAQGETATYFANKLGEVRVEQGRDDEAIPLFLRAVTGADDLALPHFNLGALYEKRGDTRPATKQYERAIAIKPRTSRPQFNLGRIHAASGDVERARQLWEASLESNPDFVQGHYYLAKLLMDTSSDLAAPRSWPARHRARSGAREVRLGTTCSPICSTRPGPSPRRAGGGQGPRIHAAEKVTRRSPHDRHIPHTPGAVKANGIELIYDTFGRAADPPHHGARLPDDRLEGRVLHPSRRRGFRVIRFDNRDVGQSTLSRERGIQRSTR